MNLPSIAQAKNIKGKRILLRLDLNMPIAYGKITDDFRIQAAIPTINLLRAAGAKIIIVSHLEGKGGDTLKPVADYFSDKDVQVTFVPELFTTESQNIL